MLAASSALAFIVVIVIILLSIAQFYLKNSALTSFATVVSAMFGIIIAFNYYEALAEQLISRGRAGQWAHAGCFILLFILGLGGIRYIGDLLIGPNIDLGLIAKRTTAGICSVITGLLISGVVFITLAMSPLAPKLTYNRFEQTVSNASINNPKKLALNADGFVAGLFGWISKGSLSSGKSFSMYHTDFINQIHLNGNKVSEKVFTVSSRKAVTLPRKGKKPVRKMEIDEQNLTVVRMGIINKDIADGGAKDPAKKISFTPSQIRLICRDTEQSDKIATNSIVVYPTFITIIRDKTTGAEDEIFSVKKDLGMIFELKAQDFQRRVAWLDVAFQLSERMEAILLQFKQSAVVELPKPVTSTDEIEQQLNSSESTPSQ